MCDNVTGECPQGCGPGYLGEMCYDRKYLPNGHRKYYDVTDVDAAISDPNNHINENTTKFLM